MAEQPRVIMRGKLRLTREREDALMDAVKKHREEIRKAQGWLSATECDGWAWKRKRAWLEYENDFAHRQNNKRYGKLYAHFNGSRNVPKRAIRVYKARACEALINSDPFVGMMPEGKEDVDPALPLAERVFQRCLRDSETQHGFRSAIEQACISEAILKITKIKHGGGSEIVESRIWLDDAGEPLKDSRGQWIFEDDKWENDPNAVDGEILQRDPSSSKPPGAVLSEPRSLRRDKAEEVTLSMQPVGWENFGCDPREADIHSAPCIYHEFHWELGDLWRNTKGLRLSAAAKDWVAGLKNRGKETDSSGDQPALHRGEVDDSTPAASQVTKLHLCESWLRFDALDNGEEIEICVLWDIKDNYPVHYDYMEEVSDTGKRPFEPWRVIPVRGRWYGLGFYDLLSDEHDFIDRTWNKIDARNSTSGRFTWHKEGSIVEARMGMPIDLSTPRVWTIDKTVTDPRNAFGFQELPALDDNLWKMLEMVLQAAQLLTGTMTPGDGNLSNMPANNTATGITALTAESELMSGDTTQDVSRGAIASLRQACVAVFADLDKEAVRLQLGSEQAAVLEEWLQTHKPKDMLYYIRLLMTKTRSKQQLEANTQAWNMIVGSGRSWLDLVQENPQFAAQVKPLAEGILNALDYPHTDQILKIPPPPTPNEQGITAPPPQDIGQTQPVAV